MKVHYKPCKSIITGPIPNLKVYWKQLRKQTVHMLTKKQDMKKEQKTKTANGNTLGNELVFTHSPEYSSLLRDH